MNNATNFRPIVTKAALWFIVGIASIVAALRYARGLGVSTALTDKTPWGLWIGFDVMAGVALAAGGFVIAATVYIFGRKHYHGVARPAILTAFLGYLAVIIGLLVDLGRPWNIWQMIVHWNPHSPLFEVGWCVMLYTTVLALEFIPVAFENMRWAGPIVRTLRRLTLPLVIIGIALSSLHQSSLGTLLLLAEWRMPPLWFSPLLPPMFLISAIALGLAMVSLESVISSWLYRRKAEWPQLAGLTRAAAVVLAIYLALRLGDLIVRGNIGLAFDGSWLATLFWIELGMSTIAPILLFSLPRLRGEHWAMGWGALLTVAGFILHRANVGGISHIAITGDAYVPALSEVIVSMGVVSGLGLVFLFFVEHLNVWEERPETADPLAPTPVDPSGTFYIRSPWFGGGQRAALAWIFGAVVGIAVMEVQLAGRSEPAASPVAAPHGVLLARTPHTPPPGHEFALIATPGGEVPADIAAAMDAGDDTQARTALLIDSGGAGRYVAFEHAAHQGRLGGETSCATCHHRNVALDRATSCHQCHRDMYRETDTFDHQRHVTTSGGKQSCIRCHTDTAAAKTRSEATSCDSCHEPVAAALTQIPHPVTPTQGMAVGYKQALHGLCIPCHQEHEQARAVEAGLDPETAASYLTLCTTCHRNAFADQQELWRRAGLKVVAQGLQP